MRLFLIPGCCCFFFSLIWPSSLGAESIKKRPEALLNQTTSGIGIGIAGQATTPTPKASSNLTVESQLANVMAKNGTTAIPSEMPQAAKDLAGKNGTQEGPAATGIIPKNESNLALELGDVEEKPKAPKEKQQPKAPLAKPVPEEPVVREEENGEEEGEDGMEDEAEPVPEGNEPGQKQEEQQLEAANQQNGQKMPQPDREGVEKQLKQMEMREFMASSEQSHAFLYFILLAFFLAALYLISHNRKKIIGCILEGRGASRSKNGSSARYRRLSQGMGEKEQQVAVAAMEA